MSNPLTKQFGSDKATELLKVLRDVLQRDINVIPVCRQITRHMSHSQRLELVHFLLGIAKADGHFHPSEAQILSRIAGYLNVNSADFRSMTAMYDVDNDRYYRILEIDKSASQEEIKSAYRKMAKKYHPDRLGNVGEDVKASAAEKFLKVQEAYEKLYKG
ncbi:MAG: TerB family tellurite resistance protein [Flavobacteriales bacterium]